MGSSLLWVTMVVLLATSGWPRNAVAQSTIALPDVVGDQLLFFYDARTGRVPFLSVSNPGSTGITIEVAFYDLNLARIGQDTCSISGAGNVVIDPTSSGTPCSAAGAANGNAGLAVITPISDAQSMQPVVPPAPLTGNFTLANTTLGSAFGENAIGRLAVDATQAHATPGQNVDGSTIHYQRFTPSVLMVPVYFNPNSLGAPENDGNRVILAFFGDQYGPPFDVTPVSSNPTASFFTNGGQLLASQPVSVNGVLLSNLQQLAGGASFSSSGKLFFAVSAGSGNVFGIFSQSQGTFASGQRMPAVDSVPSPSSGPSPTPHASATPAGSPTPVPSSSGSATCGNGVVDGDEDCDGSDLGGEDCSSQVGGSGDCTGTLTCTSDCHFNFSACVCPCEEDFDCNLDIDCSVLPQFPDCTDVTACVNGNCVTSTQATQSICSGTDPGGSGPRCGP